MTNRGLRLVAPAKLTVSLRVTGRRTDGFHLIDAEMVSLALHDELTVRPHDRIELTITAPKEVVEAFETHRQLVMGETLAVEATASVQGTEPVIRVGPIAAATRPD